MSVGQSRSGGPLGEQDSANCGSGRGWPLGGEFQREERSPLELTSAHHAERGELAQKGEKLQAGWVHNTTYSGYGSLDVTADRVGRQGQGADQFALV